MSRLKAGQVPFKTEDPYNKSNTIYIQLRHAAGAHKSTKQKEENGKRVGNRDEQMILFEAL